MNTESRNESVGVGTTAPQDVKVNLDPETLRKIMKDYKNMISGVMGPESVVYKKMYTDKNASIFKYIKNLNEVDKSNTYDGNIFIVKHKEKANYYNIFSICEFLLYKFLVGNIIDSSKNSSIVIKLFNTAL